MIGVNAAAGWGPYLLLISVAFTACRQPPDPPVVEGPRIAVQDIATELPFVGEEGLDAYGYPWRRPDRLQLLNLLRLRRYELLDSFLDDYQTEFENDFRKEYWADRSLSAFFVADASLEPLFDEWIERMPESFAAHAARGNYRYKLAWHFRGGKFAAETSSERFDSMGQYMELAAADLSHALELRPRFVAAYRRLAGILSATGASDREQRGVLLAALEECPQCLLIRSQHLKGLQPRWGGTYGAMENFAAGVRSLLAENPRLRLLQGAADTERCVTLRKNKRYVEAHQACDRALEIGDSIGSLLAKSRLLSGEDRHQEALVFLDRAVRIAPHDDWVRKRRYWSARKLGSNWRAAGEEFLLARQLNPTDDWIAGHVEYMVDKLRYEGDVRYKAGEHQTAAELFAIGLQLAPDDKDLMHRQAWNQKQSGASPGTIETQLEASPDDFELRLMIDHGWAADRRFDLVVAMWDGYIEHHPTDPRPFRERAGARWHLRQRSAAVADMSTACELGMDKACAEAEAMARN